MRPTCPRPWIALIVWCCLGTGAFAQAETGTLIDTGNALRFDFPTAQIPTGLTSGWGETCGLIYVGHTAGAALWYQRDAEASTRGHVAALDLLVVSPGLAPGTAITYAIAKAQGDIYTAERNWRGYLHKTPAGDLKLVFVIDEDLEQVAWMYPATGSLSPGVVYRTEHTYDIAHQRIAWAVNGELINEAAMVPGNPQNSATRILGSSGSSDGRDTVFLVGNISWDEVQP